MTVVAPADARETAKATRAAASQRRTRLPPPGPRPPRPSSPTRTRRSRLGRAYVLRPGDDVTVVAAGTMVSLALDAADLLGRSGVSARVINQHTIKPVDAALLEAAARETGGLVTVEEHSIIGGLGGAVCEAVAERWPVPVERVGVQDTFGESGKPDELWQKYGLTPERIADAARRVLVRKRR